MRIAWDDRARRNAYYYIASWKSQWTADEFFASGRLDVETLLAPRFDQLSFDPGGKKLVEVGCGMGRITRTLAQLFDTVYGADVSWEMLFRARQMNSALRNVQWILCSGEDLAVFSSASVDCVLSYLVLQHIPSRETAMRLIAEMIRILKPRGVFLFQFNSLQSPTMNWRGRVAWRVIDFLHDRQQSPVAKSLAKHVSKTLGLDPVAAGSTWRGAVLDVRTVLETVQMAGGVVSGIDGWGTQQTWCYGTRKE